MKIYHIFTNNFDEWLKDKKEAIRLFNEWKKEYGTCRLYEMDIEDEDKEYCIKSYGHFPF